MIIKLEEILENGLSLTLTENPEIFPVLVEMREAGELHAVNPVTIALKAIRVRDLVEIEGIIETAFGLSCSRCLADFLLSVKTDFTLTFTKKISGYSNERADEGQELTAEETDMILYKGDKIHLRDAIQEQIIFSIPFKPLCSEACKGLCMHCGSNLNETACQCRPSL